MRGPGTTFATANPAFGPFAPAEVGDAPSSARQFVTFSAGGRAFGIDIMAVREIRSWSPTTDLPDAPSGARGVLDIRGSIVEVYDLSMLLGGPATAAMPGHVVLVVAFEGIDIGILADAVSDIIVAEPADFRHTPTTGRVPGQPGRVAGLVRHEESLVTILNLQGLFDRSEPVFV